MVGIANEGCAGCLSPSRRLHTPEGYELGKREGLGFPRPGPFAWAYIQPHVSGVSPQADDDDHEDQRERIVRPASRARAWRGDVRARVKAVSRVPRASLPFPGSVTIAWCAH